MGALTPAQVIAQIHLIQSLMSDVMKDGEHYGNMPFQKEGEKKVLFKSGSEKLGFTFRLTPSFEIDQRDFPNGHREIRVVTTLTHIQTGEVWGEGVGCATTMESKYRYRNSERKCPHCLKETIIKGKDEYGGGWLCFAKRGGCGAKFKDGDASIEKQVPGKVEHPDPADYYNTVLKIAKKRSHVDAMLTATAASDIFTQDLDDMADLLAGQVIDVTPKEQPAAKKADTQRQQPARKAPTPAAEDVSQEILPEPLANPWMHKIQCSQGVSIQGKGRYLFEASYDWMVKYTSAALRNRLSPEDIANIIAAQAQPELKEPARAAVMGTPADDEDDDYNARFSEQEAA
jgi:hypothetical protein